MSRLPTEAQPTNPPAAAGDLDVERDSDVPISTQIYWQLAYQIDSGRLQPGERLSPVRELGAALRVNPNTIRAVYRRLAETGYVTTRQGAGTHVAERPPQRRSQLADRRQAGTRQEPAGVDLIGELPVDLRRDRDVRVALDVEVAAAFRDRATAMRLRRHASFVHLT